MAPSTTASNRGQPGRRQAAPKSIAPALPLPFLQKQKQKLQLQRQQAEREEAEKETAKAQAQADVVAPSTPTPSQCPASPVDSAPSPAIVNGSSDTSASVKAEETSEVTEPEEAVTPGLQTEKEVQESTTDVANEQSEVTMQEQSIDGDRETGASAPSAPPSSASIMPFQMPPPFVPASQSTNGPTSVTFVPQAQHNPPMPNGFHHTHPSNGSIMFGYPESTNSSPAPPVSAGNVPPYIHQQQAYSNQHASNISNGSYVPSMPNGYSQTGPPPAPVYNYPQQAQFMNHGPPGPENYVSQQMPPYLHAEMYTPSGPGFENQHFANHQPSTPHSHESQASVPNDQETAIKQAVPATTNVANGHINVYQQQQLRSAHPSYNNQPLPPPQGYADSQDGLLYYLLSALNNGQLADYVLELRYPDDSSSPQIINGHSLMFARSPVLKNLIEQEAGARNCLDLSNHSITRLGENSGLTEKRLLLVSQDHFLRSDGFSMAIQRLYGGTLLDTQNIPVRPDDRFDFALGYAAAGHILQVESVFVRGVEIAGSLISWSTLEKALGFALDGGLDSQWSTDAVLPEESKRSSTYGPAVNMMIYEILAFFISNFPPDFVLDPSVGDTSYSRRLPAADDRRPSQNPRLSQIKFGDHSDVAINISKILLNLPYHLVKRVLESQMLPFENYAGTSPRSKLMDSVINEREKRRHRAAQVHNMLGATNKAFDATLRLVETVDRDLNGRPIVIRYDPSR